MKALTGNFKGPQGEQGIEGKKGDTGEIGPRGSIWTSGTGITGTSTIGTIFETSGITDAHLHDYYINTDTGNLYECIVPGAADVAEWVHVGNFKGPTGATGPAGSISNINEQKPTYEEASKLENIDSGETVAISFGKLKKALSVFLLHYMQKATTSILGHVKLSNSSAITKAGEYALDAIEKNATVEGTLANLISQQNSNLYYKSGDVIEYRYYLWICGTLTGGNKEIWITIPLNKPILGTPKITLTPYMFIVRQNGLYLKNITSSTNFIDSGIEVQTRGHVNGTGITFVFVEHNGFGGDNNDAVAVCMAYKITFV